MMQLYGVSRALRVCSFGKRRTGVNTMVLECDKYLPCNQAGRYPIRCIISCSYSCNKCELHTSTDYLYFISDYCIVFSSQQTRVSFSFLLICLRASSSLRALFIPHPVDQETRSKSTCLLVFVLEILKIFFHRQYEATQYYGLRAEMRFFWELFVYNTQRSIDPYDFKLEGEAHYFAPIICKN